MFLESCNVVSPQWNHGMSAGTLLMRIRLRPSTSSIDVEAFLTLKGRQVPSVNKVKYLGAIFAQQLHGE
jgi:hypothetical protein